MFFQSNPPLPPRELLTTHSGHSCHSYTAMSSHNAHSVHSSSSIFSGSSIQSSLAVMDALTSAYDYIQRADQSSCGLVRAIEDLSGSGDGIKHFDPELLVLKATAQSTITTLRQCLSILQQQQLAPLPPPPPPPLPPLLHSSMAHSSSTSSVKKHVTVVPPADYDPDKDSKEYRKR
ncbi:hypothetical protein C0J52_04535 [Blattella germanica]|nr:hypothetical protein C0J52_04535 [Blattella germanica]